MPMINEAIFCLEQNVAKKEAIDEIMKLGMAHPMGPLKLADLIGPAINFAENGHPISPRAGKVFQDSKNRLKQFPSSAKIFLKPDGNVYKEGDLFKNNDLANTLKFIRDNGIDSFYKGEIAEKIIKEFKSAGGILDKDSFLNQKIHQ